MLCDGFPFLATLWSSLFDLGNRPLPLSQSKRPNAFVQLSISKLASCDNCWLLMAEEGNIDNRTQRNLWVRWSSKLIVVFALPSVLHSLPSLVTFPFLNSSPFKYTGFRICGLRIYGLFAYMVNFSRDKLEPFTEVGF